MTFKVGDLVRRTGVSSVWMLRGSVWEVVGVEISDNGYQRIKVPRLGWYAAEGFALDKAASDPVVLLKATPHKWAKEIIAWANGAEIEVLHAKGVWVAIAEPSWSILCDYRIKPEKKPDVVKFMSVWTTNPGVYTSEESHRHQEVGGELKLTFCGETGKLKAVELLV